MAKSASYGIDAPTVVRNLAVAGVVCTGVGMWARTSTLPEAVAGFAGIFAALVWPGVAWLVTAAWMIFGSKVLKLRSRDRLLDRVALKEGETVLDVGCGRGLLLIGAAKRIGSAGRAVGLDLWLTVDQSGNDPKVTTENATLEGVVSRVKLETGDMTKMPFADASFDAVVSSWAIHNVPSRDGRAKALHEIARVLKPGGRFAILDIGPGSGYADELRAAGLVDVVKALDSFTFFIPTWRTSGRKQAPPPT